MIGFVKQYPLILGLIFSTITATFAVTKYSIGVELGNVPTDANATQGLACSQKYPEHIYILTNSKVLIIHKSTTKLLFTISVYESDNSNWIWDDIAAGPCGDTINAECIYLAKQVDLNTARLIRLKAEGVTEDRNVELSTGNDVTIDLPSTFKSLSSRSMFIEVDQQVNVYLLQQLEGNGYSTYKINRDVWESTSSFRPPKESRTDINLPSDITFNSLSWNQQNGRIIAQVGDKSNEMLMFNGQKAGDSMSSILERKGHHMKLRLPGNSMESVCYDTSTSNIYAIASSGGLKFFLFEKEEHSEYQSDEPRGQASEKRYLCEDQNKHCSTWAQNQMCDKRKSYMMEYCPKSCGSCRERERMSNLPKCVDRNHLCAVWAGHGNCVRGSSKGYMEENCKSSCNLCSQGNSPMSMCRDEYQYCYGWAQTGRCKSRPDYMEKHCKASCGKCPVVTNEESLQRDQASVSSSQMGCKDMSEHCDSWAQEGKCEGRKDYMFLNCPASCGLCGKGMEEEEMVCEDTSEYCLVWEAYGYCEAKASYMMKKCPAACNQCRKANKHKPTNKCMDHDEHCETYSTHHMCTLKPAYMKENCPKSCGKCKTEDTSNRIFDANEQPTSVDTTVKPVKQTTVLRCVDKNRRCPDWVEGGYCTIRPDYMSVYCRKSCDFCQNSSNAQQTTESYKMREQTTTTKATEGCSDKNERCSQWTEAGYCQKRADYMTVHCKRSCDLCSEDSRVSTRSQPTTMTTKQSRSEAKESQCVDSKEYCKIWAAANLCKTKAQVMNALCPVSCNVCQTGPDQTTQTSTTRTQTTRYVADSNGCSDKSSLCTYWQEAGFCTSRELYMKQTCPKTCGLCDQKMEKPKCKDKSRFCSTWAQQNRCGEYRSYMEVNCAKTCNYCNSEQLTTERPSEKNCRDEHKFCKRWSNNGYCDIRKDYMGVKCKKSCKLCK